MPPQVKLFRARSSMLVVGALMVGCAVVPRMPDPPIEHPASPEAEEARPTTRPAVLVPRAVPLRLGAHAESQPTVPRDGLQKGST